MTPSPEVLKQDSKDAGLHVPMCVQIRASSCCPGTVSTRHYYSSNGVLQLKQPSAIIGAPLYSASGHGLLSATVQNCMVYQPMIKSVRNRASAHLAPQHVTEGLSLGPAVEAQGSVHRLGTCAQSLQRITPERLPLLITQSASSCANASFRLQC